MLIKKAGNEPELLAGIGLLLNRGILSVQTKIALRSILGAIACNMSADACAAGEPIECGYRSTGHADENVPTNTSSRHSIGS